MNMRAILKSFIVAGPTKKVLTKNINMFSMFEIILK